MRGASIIDARVLSRGRGRGGCAECRVLAEQKGKGEHPKSSWQGAGWSRDVVVWPGWHPDGQLAEVGAAASSPTPSSAGLDCPASRWTPNPAWSPKSHPAVLCCFSGWSVLQASQRVRARWALLVTVAPRMLFCELKGRIRHGWMRMAFSDGVPAGQAQASIFWGSSRRHPVILVCPGPELASGWMCRPHPRLPECNSRRPQAGIATQAGGFAAGEHVQLPSPVLCNPTESNQLAGTCYEPPRIRERLEMRGCPLRGSGDQTPHIDAGTTNRRCPCPSVTCLAITVADPLRIAGASKNAPALHR